MSNSLNAVEEIIGYSFSDKALLEAAFTHSSYVNEHRASDNERIEFLGDCVLNFIVGERLYFSEPNVGEGALSARRSALVSRAPLSRLVDELGFMDYLRVGAGVDKSAFSDKTRSDLFEAVIGAVYADGGLDACRRALDKVFFGHVVPECDYKTKLQEFAVKAGAAAEYDVTPTGGGFDCRVTVGERAFCGFGKTKHAAEIDAAKTALTEFDG